MEIRSLFQKIFGTGDNVGNQQAPSFRLLNSYVNVFNEYENPAFSQDATVRSIIDCIARHCSKLKPMHFVQRDGKTEKPESGLDYNSLLQYRPNPYMSAADFLYKVVSKVYLLGNCFINIQRDDGGRVTGLYPLDFSTMELKEVDGNLYCLFSFNDGHRANISYDDIIHLRRNYANSEILGDNPNDILAREINLLNTCKKSIENEIKNATAMRGYLKYSTMVKEKDKEKAAQDFNSIANNNGIGVLDADAEYVDLSAKPVSASHEQLEFLRQDIYRAFGISENILNGNYSEEQWQAFFESVVEPFSIQLGLELTTKLFSPAGIAYGNRIVVDENRLQYASTQHKADMAYKLLPQGIITIDEAREMLNMPPCGDPELGNKHFMTLNNKTVQDAAQDDATKGDENNG